jgi:serine/threonine-protein kinase
LQTRLRIRSKRRFRMASAIFVALAVIAVAAYALMPKPTGVPDVRGQTLEEATATLDRMGLKAGDAGEVFHDVAPAGTVVDTDPSVGTRVTEGAVVELTVSKGPQLFSVPDVIGKPLDEAKILMQNAGFTLSSGKEEFHDTIPKGAVVSRDPDGTSARKGTNFTAVVSKGPPLVAVPKVDLRTPAEAKTLIEKAGFEYASSSAYSDTVPEGKVVRTDPVGGEMAPRGSTVTAVVSKGPPPFPMPNLVGMSLPEAKRKARSMGLVVANEYAVPGSGNPHNQVQGQNPTPGSTVHKGSPIDLYYST